MNNLFLALAVAAVTYAWYRRGFALPSRLAPFTRFTTGAVVLLGCGVAVIMAGHTLGEIVQGYTHTDLGVVHHVERAEHPALFWTQILLQLVVGVGLGLALIAMGRAGRRAPQRT